MKEILSNDKVVVVIAVFIIAMTAMVIYGTASENIVTAVVSGLFGIAVGKNLSKGE